MMPPSSQQAPLVLLADHDRPRAERLRRLLTQRGTDVLEVESLAAAVSALRDREGIQILLLDLSMPRDARALSLDRVRSEAPMLAVVLLAKDYQEPAAREAVKWGAQAYLLDSQLEADLVHRTLAHAVTQRQSEIDLALAEGALQECERHYRDLFDMSHDAICLVDGQGIIFDANRAAFELLGAAYQDVVGRVASSFLVRQEDRQRVHAAVASRQTILDLDVPLYGSDGSSAWVTLSVVPRENVLGKARGSYLLFQDFPSRTSRPTSLRGGFYDPLTRLPNRALLLDRLNQLLSRYRRHGEILFAVLFVDLDRFKDVNDHFGHSTGDDLLRQVAGRLLESIRQEDTAARLGGDEFVVLLGQMDAIEDAMFIANRILERVDRPFVLLDREIRTSCSIGIAVVTPEATTPEELLRQADYAMYQAKNLGPGRYQIYDRAMQERILETLRLDADLRRALTDEEFAVYYQPVVEAETGRVKGFEALVRWQHPERGLIPSSQFVPVAEERGFIEAIGTWVLAEVCRQLKEWRDRYPTSQSLEVSVNLSTAEFLRRDFVDDVKKMIGEHRVPPGLLRFELKESTLAVDPELTMSIFGRLRDLGIRVSIDDFGLGFPSWSYLDHTPVDSLKIPRERRNGTKHDRPAPIQHVARLAQCLGMSAVAEGVETEQELRESRDAGSQLAQGYFFWEPLTAEDAAALLENPPGC